MRGLAIFIAVLLTAGSAFAATLVLQPGSEGKDSQLTSHAPTRNRGTRIFLTDNWGAVATRGIVEFEGLSGIPKGSRVDSAELQLYNSSGNNPNDLWGIYRCTAAWQEMVVTWSNQPGHFATPYAKTIVNGRGYYKWDIKTLVQEWVAGTNPNYGFKIVREDEPGLGNYPYLDSSDHTTTDWRPKLTVDYSPVGIAPTSFGKVKALFN